MPLTAREEELLRMYAFKFGQDHADCMEELMRDYDMDLMAANHLAWKMKTDAYRNVYYKK